MVYFLCNNEWQKNKQKNKIEMKQWQNRIDWKMDVTKTENKEQGTSTGNGKMKNGNKA